MLLKPLQLGFIGCDGYAFQMFKRISTVPRLAKVVAATSVQPDSEGTRIFREQNIPIFPTVVEMLEFGDGKFDAVVNPTPIHCHEPITIQCLEAGVPVFLEKPPVASLEEHRNLLRASEIAGLPVAVCFNTIYSILSQRLKGEIVGGRYGALRRIRNVGAWIRPRAYYRRNDWAGRLMVGDRWVLDGTINNPFAHYIANALYFAGPSQHSMAMPLTVEAELYHANPIESEDTSSTRIITAGGVEILSHFTLCAEEIVEPFTIIECDEAVITFVPSVKVEIEFRNGRREVRECYREDRMDMLEELCVALRLGERFPCDLQTCLPFTATVNAAFLSAWPTRPVPDHALRQENGNTPRTEIAGINRDLLRAHKQGGLLSEVGVDWARTTKPVKVTETTSVRQLIGRFPERSAPRQIRECVSPAG